MVQYAVTLKDGDWTVFCDGKPMERGMTRSAAIQLAKDMAFEAETLQGTVALDDDVVAVHFAQDGSGGDGLSGARGPGLFALQRKDRLARRDDADEPQRAGGGRRRGGGRAEEAAQARGIGGL